MKKLKLIRPWRLRTMRQRILSTDHTINAGGFSPERNTGIRNAAPRNALAKRSDRPKISLAPAHCPYHLENWQRA